MRLSPELQFISNILALSLKPSHSHIAPNPILGHLNWDEFMLLASYHGVGGLLLYWLKRLGLVSNLPTDVYKDLYGIHESYSKIWENYHEIIKKILRRFYKNQIDVILLKGAQLAYTDYPHVFLRPMGDIDLLVNRSDQSRVIKLMLEMGFNLYEPGDSCNRFFIKGVVKGKEKNMYKPVFIEVHSNFQAPIRLNKSFGVDMDEFWSGTKMKSIWNGTQIKSIAGFPFLQLSPTYNVIYLCTHFGEHHFSRLIWAYDIALHIHRHGEEIDWETLKDICPRMKIRSPLYHSFSLCQELFQIPIHEGVLKNLSQSWWRKRICHYLLRRNSLFPGKSRFSHLSQFLIKMLCIDNWLEAALWFLLPTREWMKKQYSLQSTRWIYSYYILHPILYLVNAIRTPLR
ncbi:MAG: nucleotidyltransferase family protein [Candidatus Hodarchaeota archaeon]